MQLEMDWIDIRRIAYALYCDEWIRSHDEGTPVCFNEFVDNEYLDWEYMQGLFYDPENEPAEGLFEVYVKDPLIEPIYYNEEVE